MMRKGRRRVAALATPRSAIRNTESRLVTLKRKPEAVQRKEEPRSKARFCVTMLKADGNVDRRMRISVDTMRR